jgi:hypothetical protein
VGLTITLPGEVYLLLGVEYTGEEDKDTSIFISNNLAKVVVRYLI